MKIFREDEDTFTFILAPLMDVMLFILMFFMLSYGTDSFFQDVSLPSAKNSLKKENSSSFWVLDYDKQGRLFLDGKAISSAQLPKTLNQDSSDKSLILRADKNLSYQKVMDIMDILKKSGISKIYLATQSS